LDGVVNKQNVWAILAIRESSCVSWEGASCTKNYSVGCHLKSWTARANFLWRDIEQWVLFKHVVQYICASPSCYRFALQTEWFMQYGNRPHTANVLDFLHVTLDLHVISNWFPDRSSCGQNSPPPFPKSWSKPMWLLPLLIP
jgi:hypothetical protein